MSLVTILTSLVTRTMHSSLYTGGVSVWICLAFFCRPTRLESHGA